MTNKTLIVNLFGAPSSGKSTGAAYIFSRLKMLNINAELVTEFAKDKVYEENKSVFENQAYIFGKQYFRISRLLNKVDVIVTDSPLLLSVFYNKSDVGREHFNNYVRSIHDSLYVHSLSYFVRRVKPYNPSGRFQTESESDKLAQDMINFLAEDNIPTVSGNEDGYKLIISDILRELR
jgi:nicotinamide riboside kinase